MLFPLGSNLTSLMMPERQASFLLTLSTQQPEPSQTSPQPISTAPWGRSTVMVVSRSPDGPLHPGPDGAFHALRGTDVIPVEPRVGDLLLRFRVGSHTLLRGGHDEGQGPALRLKLYHMELLLSSQGLVGLLQREEEKVSLKQCVCVCVFMFRAHDQVFTGRFPGIGREPASNPDDADNGSPD